MDLRPYIDHLRSELAVAAEAGGEDARALAERLTAPLESTMRLTLLNALSDAAGEITRELAPGSVDVRLRGLDPEFVVTSPPTDPSFGEAAQGSAPAPPAPPAPPRTEDDEAITRINLRLPEHLKVRIEAAATRESLSVNAWLVRALGAAV
ncbi:toxin-antitoxin system HicB family antitoxin, partial [Streptomyces sp. SID3343]|uniref:toxin-antitoxin system HicB family antitoxin n=1 Tax=Streptomyces sp. SID3343 TaxID=2690260 RepID=UPI00136AEA92